MSLVRHQVGSSSPTGPGKHQVGRPLQGKDPGGVVSTTQCSSEDFSNLRVTRSRPIRVPMNYTATPVLLPGQERQPVPGSRRARPAVGLRRNVRVSPSSLDPVSSPEVQTFERQTAADRPILGRCTLAPRAHLAPLQRAEEAQVQTPPPDQQVHRPPTPIPQPAPADGMAAFKTILTASGISEEIAQFLSASWRRSTAGQYRSVWKSWSEWCQERGVDPARLSLNTLLEYLYYLYMVKNRAWSTVGVHRSAISSLLQPLEAHPLGEHPIVARFMRALFLKRPPATQPRWTWDLATVLNCIRDWGLPQDLSLRRLTWKMAFLVAVFSARRMADLFLLRVTPKFLQRSAGSAVFQPEFGAKQDRPGHQNISRNI
jgi:hypothetical protein